MKTRIIMVFIAGLLVSPGLSFAEEKDAEPASSTVNLHFDNGDLGELPLGGLPAAATVIAPI